MNILEYALDVNKDVSLIIDLCKNLGIKKQNEDDFLTEDEIIMLDNELDSMKENLNPDYELDEELEEKVDALVSGIDIDLDEVTTKKEKVKSKVELKSDAKAKYLKGKKEIYKHRDKLMDNKEEDDVILYKEGMTVAELALVAQTPLKVMSGYNGKVLCRAFKKEKHEEICCFRCGYVYSGTDTCPKCGYKSNQ